MDVSYAQLMVTAGSASVGIAALLWAMRVTDGARGSVARMKAEMEKERVNAEKLLSLFGAHPGMVLVWENEDGAIADGQWGAPRLFGSPLALASLLRFSDGSAAADPGVRILQGLAGFQGRDASGRDAFLAPALTRLRREGQAFSMTISNAQGLFVEIDGRTAGARAVVWIVDAGVRGVEEIGGRGQIEEQRHLLARDPSAFMEMMARTPAPAWRISGGGKLEWANDAYVKALDGKSVDAAVQRNLLLDAKATEQARRAIDEGRAIEEVRPVALGGERRTLRIVTFPLAGGAAGVAFDVTDEEAAKADLARFTRAHDQTLDALADGVAIFGPDKRLMFHNRAFAQMWDLDPVFLAEKPSHAAWLDALKEKRRLPAHPHYPEWRAGELAAYQDVGPVPETLWQLSDRTLRVVKQSHPLGGLLMIFSDMTNELKLKTQYNALLQVQRAALDKLHEAVAVFGLDGRMRLSNAAFAETWKVDPAQLQGEISFDGMVDLCLPLYHDRAQWTQIRGRITDPSPQARQEYRGEMRRSDGSFVTFLTRPLPDGATLLAFADVTASKRVEDALRDRAEAFEAADRLKTEFVENVSYQLRTPLQTIHGFAEMMAKFIFGPLNDRQRDQVSMILNASDSLKKLVDNILDVAMIDAGRLELELTDVDIADLLAEAAAMVQTKAHDAQVTLKLECGPDVGLIRVDGKRIKQALVNLLSNAVRFAKPGDVVTVGAERLDQVLRLWVSDEGVGIPYDAQATAFDPFTSGDRRGAGLGLALVRSFVELHGGWVALHSEPGAGVTVTCHLPALAAAAERASTPEPQARPIKA